MYCPVCDNVKMREVEKHDVLIDICPSCKGVWLDRGELEKILQSAREIRQPFNEWYEGYRKEGDYHHAPAHYPGHYSKHSHHKHKKKKTIFDILDDLF
ncbi:MAG: cytoplasmic protein [Bacillus thermozeamaize]|uniref:Cytoplasmic protein n=1 Tax=Bacillus thermozeamaize TaxID=230954 RepID=A0A1Y3PBD0_9BACI|nr:MAG: cytoplasmic protein [Bacillus thermozeamaize]